MIIKLLCCVNIGSGAYTSDPPNVADQSAEMRGKERHAPRMLRYFTGRVYSRQHARRGNARSRILHEQLTCKVR